ncbi:hypothetical protein, partial [Yersinia enterocolitica]
TPVAAVKNVVINHEIFFVDVLAGLSCQSVASPGAKRHNKFTTDYSAILSGTIAKSKRTHS